MNRPQDVRIKEAVISFEDHPFRTPLKFGGRVMDKHRLINVEVVAETRDRKKATGFGSMPVGNIWAWPSTQVTPDQAVAAMCDFAERVCRLTDAFDEFGHPIDAIYHISAEYEHLGKVVSRDHKLPEPIPELAQLVAASALDAAIHDAYGKVNLLNSYNMLSKQFMKNDLSYYLDDQFKGEYLDQYTLREPKPRMPLYHLVGALDPLTEADLQTRLKDGLPETLPEWIKADGLTHLKIKMNGDNLDWDVERVIAIDRVTAEAQAARGCTEWFYSIDFNEKCANVDYVLDFLKRVKEQTPAGYDRIQYIEQPTHRNLREYPDNKMHKAAELKPVVIDESLLNYDALLLARDLGYSGVALKACKGHTEALFAAAAAQKFGMFLCVQDLTCPGYSFLHSASLAARIPGVAAIEGNGRQYCPGANRRWEREFPTMFDITDGTVGTAALDGFGLGF
ncbi:enolase C-terminal domain-like protein [Planctomicrobium sp. SH664]|uniref:enolase C-terminal domain-like protein n=1 Tax=Planctomicrobium sp. SH664 TaxID=3448125 RepID=UPI003F5BDE48